MTAYPLVVADVDLQVTDNTLEGMNQARNSAELLGRFATGVGRVALMLLKAGAAGNITAQNTFLVQLGRNLANDSALQTRVARQALNLAVSEEFIPVTAVPFDHTTVSDTQIVTILVGIVNDPGFLQVILSL